MGCRMLVAVDGGDCGQSAMGVGCYSTREMVERTKEDGRHGVRLICWLLQSKGAKAIPRQAHRARAQRATQMRRRHPHHPHCTTTPHARTDSTPPIDPRPTRPPLSGQSPHSIRFLPTHSAIMPRHSWPGPGRTYGQQRGGSQPRMLARCPNRSQSQVPYPQRYLGKRSRPSGPDLRPTTCSSQAAQCLMPPLPYDRRR